MVMRLTDCSHEEMIASIDSIGVFFKEQAAAEKLWGQS
jgi:hypothetical protein